MSEQRTIERVVKARGIGIYSGNIVNIALFPAPNNHGIVFIRKDMPGKLVHAYSNTFIRENGCTCFENQGVKVVTVEHLMDALEELEIDNVLVELDTFEVPIMDGTTGPFKFLVWRACGGSAYETLKPKDFIESSSPNQKTIRKVTHIRGISVLSSKTINMDLIPAPSNHGIVFKCKNTGDKLISAYSNTFTHVSGYIGFSSYGIEVLVVEYLMYALAELKIDNVLIELDTCEIPVYTYHPDPTDPLIVMLNHTGVVTCKE
jgi:UDP-3-O-acyl-N-acetylglucosamine deacetylase